MVDSVVEQSFRERDANVVSVFSPNIVSVVACDYNRAPSVASLAIPLEYDDGALCSELLDLQYQFIQHALLPLLPLRENLAQAPANSPEHKKIRNGEEECQDIRPHGSPYMRLRQSEDAHSDEIDQELSSRRSHFDA